MNKIRILVLLSIFVLVLTSCTPQKINDVTESKEETSIADNEVHQDPPLMIKLNRDQINMLREMEKTGVSTNAEYLKSINQEGFDYSDISYLLHLIDSISVPSINDSKKETSVSYFPEKEEIYFLYKINGENHWYRFEVSLNKKAIETKESEIIQNNHDKITNAVINKNDKIKLIMAEDMSENPDLAKHYAEFWIKIDDYFAKVVYKNQEKDISKISAKDIVNGFWDDAQ